MIDRIIIKNFKNLHNVDAKLSKVNILAGINGRGKSSFLQSFLVLSQTWKKDQSKLLLPNGNWKNLGMYEDIHNVYYKNESIDFSLFSNEGKEKEFFLSYRQSEDNKAFGALELFKVDDNIVFDLGHSKGENLMGGSSSGTNETQSMMLADVRDYAGLTQLKRMYYIPSDRRAASEVENYDPDVTYLKPDGSNVLSILNDKGPAFIAEVEARMRSILDDAAISITYIGDGIKLSLNSVTDGHYYRPINVGFGFGYILTLVVASLLVREKDILIIENPEAHLHPSAQSKLMKILINDAVTKQVQLFVETHSDHIVNAALLSVKQNEIPCAKDDIEILFFDSIINQDNNPECSITNLEITRSGKIMNPPSKFGDQYAIDLKALYL